MSIIWRRGEAAQLELGEKDMTLIVRSARILRHCAPPSDALDITRGIGSDGLFLAPSWDILTPAVTARRIASANRKMGAVDLADRQEAALWAEYVPKYMAEMRESYRANRAAWDALLAMHSVTLMCYCADPLHCHRWLLRRVVLPKLGALDGGEV